MRTAYRCHDCGHEYEADVEPTEAIIARGQQPQRVRCNKCGSFNLQFNG